MPRVCVGRETIEWGYFGRTSPRHCKVNEKGFTAKEALRGMVDKMKQIFPTIAEEE